jgi:hypothetical protein
MKAAKAPFSAKFACLQKNFTRPAARAPRLARDRSGGPGHGKPPALTTLTIPLAG